MKFSISAVVLALATIAVAAPGGYGYGGEKGGDINIKQDSHERKCEAINTSANCCETATGKKSDAGLLSLLDNLDLNLLTFFDFEGCSSLAGGGSCNNKAVCCQGDSSASGAVAVNLPCVPLDLL